MEKYSSLRDLEFQVSLLNFRGASIHFTRRGKRLEDYTETVYLYIPLETSALILLMTSAMELGNIVCIDKMKEVSIRIGNNVMYHSFIAHSLVGGKTLGDYQPAFRRTLKHFSFCIWFSSLNILFSRSIYLSENDYYFS